MIDMMTVRPEWTTSSSQSVPVKEEATGGTSEPSGVFPSSIPLGQEYYWTTEWRENVELHYSEREAGDVVEFNSSDDLIQWLFENDE